MLDDISNRRKDPALRAAVDNIHNEFNTIKSKSGAYFIVLRELCLLSDSKFAVALELQHAEGQSVLSTITTCASASTPEGIKLWVQGTEQNQHAIHPSNGAKPFYRLISENHAEVFYNHQTSDMGLPEGWPSLHSFIALPILDAKNTRALILLCNSPIAYNIELHKRYAPVITTLVSMVRVLITRNEDKKAFDHLVLEKDTWRENYSLLEINAPIGMVTLNKHLEIVRVNPMAETTLKLKSIDILNKHINFLFPEKFPNEHATQTFAEGTNKNAIRLKAHNAIGETVSVEVTLIRFNEFFQPRLLLLISDATELHLIQNNMKREIQRFRALADLAPMGILQTNTDWKTDYINHRWLDICGVTEEEMQGLQWCNTFHPDEAENIITELHKALIEGALFERECKILHKSNELKWVKFHVQPLFDQLGKVNGFLATMSDNTYIHQSEERLRRMAEEDALTKLANRPLFLSRLEHALTRLKRQGAVALLSLDLDGFKNVNDSLGHDAGDQLLIQVAERLLSCTREADTISRMGGDEFNILLEGIAEANTAALVSEKILSEISRPFIINRQEVFISASIGICFAVSGQNLSAKTLLKQADMALYRAKDDGRNNYQYFSPELDLASKNRLELGNSLHKALGRAEFTVYYQFQANIKTREIVGLEALLRWVHPIKGLIGPDEFIPLLEEIGLISSVSRWIWHASFFQMKSWLDAGLVPADAVISVNLSPRQFRDPLLLTSLTTSLKDANLDATCVVIEITESALLQENGDTLKILQEFKSLGIRIALDDFGTGYSSLSHLKKYPIDIIKIDKSFIQDLLTDKDDAAIIQAVIALAHSLGLEIIAEGVETDEVLQKLDELGCQNYQGYLLNKPMPSEDIINHLTRSYHDKRSHISTY